MFGLRVTVFTSYIAESKKEGPGHIPYVRYCTTIYPGRSGNTHIIFHQDLPLSYGDLQYRVPPGLFSEKDEFFPGLMGLESFLSRGFDMEKSMILVCVRSISPRYTVHSRMKEKIVDVVEIGIYDETATAVLKLWGEHAFSASSFVSNHTILLISHPTFKILERQNKRRADVFAEVGIGHGSMLHVNPAIAEAHWLRKKLGDLSSDEDVLTRFPEGTLDTDMLKKESTGETFTIAEVDKNIRQDMDREIIGKLNIIFLEVNLISMRRKEMLCCTVW